MTFEIDHIVPSAAGGFTDFQNLCLACPMCNRYQAGRTSSADPATGETVSLFHPHVDDWATHFEWSDDASQLIGLTPEGRATIGALRMNRPQVVRTRRLWAALGEHPPATDRQ